MKVKSRKRPDPRDQESGIGPRKAWRLWSVEYRKRERLGDDNPAGVLITTSGILPLPVAFIRGGDAVKLALAVIRGTASLADARILDYRGKNWLGVGACVNGAVLSPLDSIRGEFDPSIDHLDAAMIFIDPLDNGVSFTTFDNAGLHNYLRMQSYLDWAVPCAIARQTVEART